MNKMAEKIKSQISEDLFSMIPMIKSMIIGNCNLEKNDSSKLTHSKYHVLFALSKLGPMAMSEIGNKIGLSKPNTTFVMDSLFKDGLIKRDSNQKDRRLIVISITNKGSDFLEDAKAHLRKKFEGNLSSLNEKEILEMSESLKTIKTLLLKINEKESKT